MEVAVTELRAHLGRWIDEARDGNDVVIPADRRRSTTADTGATGS